MIGIGTIRLTNTLSGLRVALSITTKEKIMNNRKSQTRLSNAYPTLGQIAHYEREARRLRAEFIAEGVANLYIAVDRLVRRIACRVAARLFGSDCMHASAR